MMEENVDSRYASVIEPPARPMQPWTVVETFPCKNGKFITRNRVFAAWEEAVNWAACCWGPRVTLVILGGEKPVVIPAEYGTIDSWNGSALGVDWAARYAVDPSEAEEFGKAYCRRGALKIFGVSGALPYHPLNDRAGLGPEGA